MAFSGSSGSRKESTALANLDGKMEKVEHGRTYRLEPTKDGSARVGVVRFIGKTFFKAGVEWFGIELTEGKGKHTGTVQGTSYFNCPKGKGIFVQISSFKKKESSKRGKSGEKVAKKDGALATGKNKDYDAAEFKQKDDGGFLGEKNVKASEGGEVAKKDGAIATGKNEDYDAAKFKTDNDGKDFLESKDKEADTTEKAAKKEGPRDSAADAPAAAPAAAEAAADAADAPAAEEAAAEPAAEEPAAAAEAPAAEAEAPAAEE